MTPDGHDDIDNDNSDDEKDAEFEKNNIDDDLHNDADVDLSKNENGDDSDNENNNLKKNNNGDDSERMRATTQFCYCPTFVSSPRQALLLNIYIGNILASSPPQYLTVQFFVQNSFVQLCEISTSAMCLNKKKLWGRAKYGTDILQHLSVECCTAFILVEASLF